jgi:CheY-like chemotaxis protein
VNRRNQNFASCNLGADLEFIDALRKALTEAGCRLVTCSDRESAILFLKSDIPYDLLLIDFEWQKEEGLKLARLARSIRYRKRMPITLAAATILNRQLETLARRAGVNECVTKTRDVSTESSQGTAKQTALVPGKSICLTPALLEGIINKLRSRR